MTYCWVQFTPKSSILSALKGWDLRFRFSHNQNILIKASALRDGGKVKIFNQQRTLPMYLSKSRDLEWNLSSTFIKNKRNASNNRIFGIHSLSLYSTETTFKAVLVDGVGHTENVRHFTTHTRAITQQKKVKPIKSGGGVWGRGEDGGGRLKIRIRQNVK